MSRKPHAPASAVLAALSLAAVTVVLPGPASAATSEVLSYSCASARWGSFPVTASHEFFDDVEYGGRLPVSTELTLPESLAQSLDEEGVRHVEWSATSHALLEGVPVVADYEATGLWIVQEPDGTGFSYSLWGSVRTRPAHEVTRAGEVADLALADRTDGDGTEVTDLALTLALHTDKDGVRDARPRVRCELVDDQELSVGPVAVEQAYTETVARLRRQESTGRLVAKALTWSSVSDLPVSGRVELVVKRNGTVFASRTIRLERERATYEVPAPARGRYKLVATYPGTRNFTASRGSALS